MKLLLFPLVIGLLVTGHPLATDYGRERTLNPWLGQEPAWRLQSSAAPDLKRSLPQAMAAARAAASRTI